MKKILYISIFIFLLIHTTFASTTVWLPFANTHNDVEFRYSTGAGYQDYILTQETPFQGLTLAPGIPFSFFLNAEVYLLQKPISFIEEINFKTQVLANYDSMTPFYADISIITKEIFNNCRIGISPSFITGYDMNSISIKTYISQNFNRVFYTVGTQIGSIFLTTDYDMFYNLFTGIGLEILRDKLSTSVEVSYDFDSRLKVASLLSLSFFNVDISGGISWNKYPSGEVFGFLTNIGVSL
jgi:hypothetical protein